MSIVLMCGVLGISFFSFVSALHTDHRIVVHLVVSLLLGVSGSLYQTLTLYMCTTLLLLDFLRGSALASVLASWRGSALASVLASWRGSVLASVLASWRGSVPASVLASWRGSALASVLASWRGSVLALHASLHASLLDRVRASLLF